MGNTFQMLYMGDYLANTGYGTVSKNLIPYFKRNYLHRFYPDSWTLDICAVNYFGDLHDEDGRTTVFSARKSSDYSKNIENLDDFGRLGFLNAIKMNAEPPTTKLTVMPGLTGKQVKVETEDIAPQQCGYDGIFIIQDVPVITCIVPLLEDIKREFKQKNQKDFKTIIYFPADHPLVYQFVKDLDFFDAIVTYNEYSRQNVLRLKPSLKGKVKVIPHGTNTTDFFPVKDRNKVADFRKEYFGENADKFIVTQVNRNQPRKDIPCSIFGFQEYHKQNPNSLLYLHMNPNDPAGHDLRAVLMQTDLQEGIDYMLPEKDKQNHGFDIAELNMIYNASDVYLTTTLGEGWGLCPNEAMACGLPVICPLHTSFIEMTDHGRRAYVLENLYPICAKTDNVIRLQSDYMEVAEKLALVHDHIKSCSLELASKKSAALKYVQSLTWESIGKQWIELMKEVY